MKLNRIDKQFAEDIIVNGKGGGFSQVTLVDIPLTIYHRIYNHKRFHIAEMNTTGMNENGKEITITTFYDLDEKEVVQILNLDKDYFNKYQEEVFENG